MTVASANLATVAVGTVSPATTNVNAGTTNYTIWSSQLSVGTRSVNLMHVSYKVIGSIPQNAFANIKLFLNGTQIATASGIDSNGLINFDVPGGVAVQTGSATLEVRADVISGSNRTFSLSLQNAADMIVVDSNYGVNVAATGIPATTGTVTISQGTVSVSVDPNFGVSTVPGGASGVIVSQFALKAYGEDMKISYLTVTPSINVDNVTLYANNAQVGSVYNYTGTALTFSLGSSLTIPAGTTVILVVKADTKSSGNNIATGTISVALSAPANNAQGMSSLQLATVPSGTVNGPSLTITSGALTVAPDPNFSSQSIVANTSNQKIGSYVLQAGSGEPLNVTNLNVALGGSFPVTSLSNLYTSVNGVNATPINPATNNNFPVSFVLATSSSQTVGIYADIGSMGTIANTNNPTDPAATTTAAANGTVATGTVTVSGTMTASTSTSVTVNGYPSTYITGGSDTTTTVATALAGAVNSNTNVNGTVSASATGGVITISAKVAGTAGNSVTLTATSSGAIVLTPSAGTLLGGTANATQVMTVTPGASNVAVGNVFSVTINSTTVNYTATVATVANVTAGLASAINGNSTLSSVVTASNQSTYVRVTANASGTAGAFTITATATNGSQSASGSTIQTTLTVAATGKISNSSANSSAVAGQISTLGSGSLNTPTLVSDSPVSQFVVGGSTNNPVADYNFVSNNGSSVITEMDFTVTSASTTVTSVSVGGQSASVVGSTSTVTGLSISVPMTYAGMNVPVSVNYNTVGLGGIPSNQTATVTLTTVKYNSGNTSLTLTPSVAANAMTLVSSKPTVTLGGTQFPNGTGPKMVNGQVLIAQVYVGADSHGPVNLEHLPISVSATGASTTISSSANNLVVKDDSNGQTLTTTNAGLGVAIGGNGTDAVAFTGGYQIQAGQSKTFDIYATVSGVSGSSGTTSVTSKLGSASLLTWDDVNGGTSGNGITGSLIYNYPTNTLTVSN